MHADNDPLVLTLALAEPARTQLEALRTRHFPAARNLVPAHLTLIHRLPGRGVQSVVEALEQLRASCRVFTVVLDGVVRLAHGVALSASSPELSELRSDLVRRFASQLRPRDRQPFRPHVTVMNNAEPSAAFAVFETLRAGWQPLAVEASGMLLWRYRQGPWERVDGDFAFRR